MRVHATLDLIFIEVPRAEARGQDTRMRSATPTASLESHAGEDPVPSLKTSMLQAPFAVLIPHTGPTGRVVHVTVGAFFTLGVLTVQVFYSGPLNLFQKSRRDFCRSQRWNRAAFRQGLTPRPTHALQSLTQRSHWIFVTKSYMSDGMQLGEARSDKSRKQLGRMVRDGYRRIKIRNGTNFRICASEFTEAEPART